MLYEVEVHDAKLVQPTHLYSVIGYVTNGGLVDGPGDEMWDLVAYDAKRGVWLQNVCEESCVVEVAMWHKCVDTQAVKDELKIP